MGLHEPKDRVYQCRACAGVLPTHESHQVCPSCKYENIFVDHRRVPPPETVRVKRNGVWVDELEPDRRCQGKAKCGGECVLEAEPPGVVHEHVCEGDAVDQYGRAVRGTCRGEVKRPAPAPTPPQKASSKASAAA